MVTSLVTSKNAPPSWIVRDPTSTAPGLMRTGRGMKGTGEEQGWVGEGGVRAGGVREN